MEQRTEPQQRVYKDGLLPYDQREGISAHDRLLAEKARRPSAAQRLAKGLAALLVVAAVLVGLFLIASAIDDNHVSPAPWSAPSAPIVRPAPIDQQ